MRAVDTNLLVRLIVRDDSAQVAAAEAFVAGGAWVSHLVLAETIWVLDAVHERSAAQLAAASEMLLNHEQLSIQDAEVVAPALARFRSRSALGFFGLPGPGDRAQSGPPAARDV
jgi:predicted nucleic-acid-binding protein